MRLQINNWICPTACAGSLTVLVMDYVCKPCRHNFCSNNSHFSDETIQDFQRKSLRISPSHETQTWWKFSAFTNIWLCTEYNWGVVSLCTLNLNLYSNDLDMCTWTNYTIYWSALGSTTLLLRPEKCSQRSSKNAFRAGRTHKHLAGSNLHFVKTTTSTIRYSPKHSVSVQKLSFM